MPEPGDGVRPPDQSWTVAVRVVGEARPIGSGTLIDATRVLTCRHFLAGRATADLRVAFSAADDPYREPGRVSRVDPAGRVSLSPWLLVLLAGWRRRARRRACPA